MCTIGCQRSINLYIITRVAALDDCFIGEILSSLFQGVQEKSIDIARLVDDNVNQSFGCSDWLTVFGLNGLQLFQCERIRLKHVTSDTVCV